MVLEMFFQRKWWIDMYQNPISMIFDSRSPSLGQIWCQRSWSKKQNKVDSESRGEEEASIILFADKIDSSSPKPRSTEQERQLLGAKAMGTENMPHS